MSGSEHLIGGVEKFDFVVGDYDYVKKAVFPKYSYCRPLDMLRYVLKHKLEWIEVGAKMWVRMYGFGRVDGREYGECGSLAQLTLLDNDFEVWYRDLEKKRGLGTKIMHVSGQCERFFSSADSSHTWLEVFDPRLDKPVVLDAAFDHVAKIGIDYRGSLARTFEVFPGQWVLTEYLELEVPEVEIDPSGKVISRGSLRTPVLGLTEDHVPLSFSFVRNRKNGQLIPLACFGNNNGRVFFFDYSAGEVRNFFGLGNPNPNRVEKYLTKAVVEECGKVLKHLG